MFRNDDIAHLLLRVGFGILLLFHGVHKLIHGIGFVQGTLQSHGLPSWFGYGVFIGEIIAPAMIVLGFYSRVAALVMAFDLLMAILLTTGFFPLKLLDSGAPMFELPLLYLLSAVILFLAGPGKYSINRN